MYDSSIIVWLPLTYMFGGHPAHIPMEAFLEGLLKRGQSVFEDLPPNVRGSWQLIGVLECVFGKSLPGEAPLFSVLRVTALPSLMSWYEWYEH